MSLAKLFLTISFLLFCHAVQAQTSRITTVCISEDTEVILHFNPVRSENPAEPKLTNFKLGIGNDTLSNFLRTTFSNAVVTSEYPNGNKTEVSASNEQARFYMVSNGQNKFDALITWIQSSDGWSEGETRTLETVLKCFQLP